MINSIQTFEVQYLQNCHIYTVCKMIIKNDIFVGSFINTIFIILTDLSLERPLQISNYRFIVAKSWAKWPISQRRS